MTDNVLPPDQTLKALGKTAGALAVGGTSLGALISALTGMDEQDARVVETQLADPEMQPEVRAALIDDLRPRTPGEGAAEGAGTGAILGGLLGAGFGAFHDPDKVFLEGDDDAMAKFLAKDRKSKLRRGAARGVLGAVVGGAGAGMGAIGGAAGGLGAALPDPGEAQRELHARLVQRYGDPLAE